MVTVKKNALAVAAGLAADAVLGEPPSRLHPVAAFGTAMERLERLMYADRRSSGVAYAALGAVVPAAAGLAARKRRAPLLYTVIAGRALRQAALEIHHALEGGDLETARHLLPALVGRDPAGLDEKEIARAVVESVAENTVDAIVAPAFWALLAGVPGALAHRALNTLDSMVGHPTHRYRHFGWASAKADDVAAWIPARLTAGLVVAVRPRRACAVSRAVMNQAPLHPSPNAGVAEAAFAAALGRTLGGTNRYAERLETRPQLGDGPPPDANDIRRAVGLCRDVTAALGAGCLALAAAL